MLSLKKTCFKCLAIAIALWVVVCLPISAAPRTTIRMWTFLDPAGTSPRELALRQIIDGFEKENPDIEVVVEPQQWDLMTAKFFAAHRVGNAPDIIWVAPAELGAALDLETLADFEGLFLDTWSAEDIADIDDAFWHWGEKDGKHYQVTLSRNYIALIYRADLFEEKGIETPIRTWDELARAAKALTEVDSATGIQRWGLGQAFSTEKTDPPLFVPALLSEQGEVFTKDGRASWATEEGEEAMGLLIDMIRTHKVTPEGAISYSVEDLYQDFCAGRYAMISGAAVRIPNLQSQATFDGTSVQMMHWPSWDGKKHSPGVALGWAVGVWSKSENKEAAAQFLQYMISPKADELWVTVGGQAPVRKSTIESLSTFFETPSNAYLQVMAEGFAEYGWMEPWEFKVSGWGMDLNNAIQSIIVNNVSIVDALEQAEDAFNNRNVR